MLREPQRGLRLLDAVELELELRGAEVEVELLAQARAAGREREGARRVPELGFGVIGAPVDVTETPR